MSGSFLTVCFGARCLRSLRAGDGGLTRLVADKAELRDVRDGTVYLVGGEYIGVVFLNSVDWKCVLGLIC